jgi:hypothetical protein
MKVGKVGTKSQKQNHNKELTKNYMDNVPQQCLQDDTKGYSLYSSDTLLRAVETPLPTGTSTPPFRCTLAFGSGSVLPKPLVLCLFFGNFSMYSAALHSYLHQESNTLNTFSIQLYNTNFSVIMTQAF